MIPSAERIDAVAKQLYVAIVHREFGNAGVIALMNLIDGVRRIYSVVEPDQLPTDLVIFRRIDGREVAVTAAGMERYALLDLPRTWQPDDGRPAVVEVLSDGYAFVAGCDLDIVALSREAIVYVYERRRDMRDIFVIRGERSVVPTMTEVHASSFAVPTFRRLDDALRQYALSSVATSRCRILQMAWHHGADGNRVLFRGKPEEVMQNSLIQYLENVLGGDAEVRPEQNTGRSNPVDVKVSWMLTNRMALVELKWIGKSIAASGKITSYSQARANSGAKQLASYLERNRQHAPRHVAVGYLVVIDGRRRNVNAATTQVSREDGMYYRFRDLEFNPSFHETRSDFAPPIRMFAEPLCL